MHITREAHSCYYLPLKIPGIKKDNDVIYKILSGCFLHTLTARSLIRWKFQSRDITKICKKNYILKMEKNFFFHNISIEIPFFDAMGILKN